jgi:hypothetical protein
MGLISAIKTWKVARLQLALQNLRESDPPSEKRKLKELWILMKLGRWAHVEYR